MHCLQEVFILVLYLNDFRTEPQPEQEWNQAVADKVAYPIKRRDFKGPAECECGEAAAGGRLQLHVRMPGDRQVFRDRHEKSQGVTRAMKRKSKPSEKWNEAMLHNLRHNVADFADKTAWGDDIASIAQAENIHGQASSTAVWETDGVKAVAKPKSKAKATAKASAKDRTGDLVTDRESARFELGNALEILRASAQRTVAECNEVLQSIRPDESLTGLRQSLDTRMKCCEKLLEREPGPDNVNGPPAGVGSWLDANQD